MGKISQKKIKKLEDLLESLSDDEYIIISYSSIEDEKRKDDFDEEEISKNI